VRPETRAKGGSPEVKPAPSERGLGAGAGAQALAGGAPTAAELRARGFSRRDLGGYAECTKPVNEVGL
jgi:hypothetical protein